MSVCLLAAGCSKGLDLKPDWGSQEEYTTKINKDLKDIGASKTEAFNWAVNDSSFEEIRERYKGKTYRQIADAEIDRQVTLAATELTQVQAELTKRMDALAEVTAEVSNVRIENDFFGKQFKFDLRINNESGLDFSKLYWSASLYLDGSNTAVASERVLSFFESVGGLKSGQTSTQTIKVGSFNPSEDWVNLTSQNAKERKVVLELQNAYDFSNKSYLEALVTRAKYLQELPKTAEKAKSMLSAPDAPATVSETRSSAKQVNRTSCTNQCTNGNCTRTFPDGTQEQWQAPRKFNPFTSNWEWDTTTNACGL